MASTAAVIGLFILICVAIIAAAGVVLVCTVAWEETSNILRRRRQRFDLDRRIGEVLSGTADPR